MAERLSRNDLCPCGSGKKFKRCCLPRGASRGFSLSSLNGNQIPSLSHTLPRTDAPAAHKSSPRRTGWNEVTFDAPLKDDGRLHVVMLYSDLGLKVTPFTIGELLTLDLPKIKFNGPATVVNIRPSADTARVEGHVLRIVQFRGGDDLGKPLHGDWKPSPEVIARWQSRRRHIFLKLDNPDGSWCDIGLLRTVDWVKEVGAQVGRMVFLDLAEVGTRGWATVLEIKPCGVPTIGPGEMVTGTFRHSHGRIGELVIESETKPLGVTPGHLIWSEDREDWVPVCELQPGESLRTDKGITRFVSYTLTDRVEPVYNLEVANDHCYRVGESGILVHNTSAGLTLQPKGKPLFGVPTTATFNKCAVIVELDGPNQERAKAIVDEAAKIAKVSVRKLRVGYAPDFPTAFFERLDDGEWALVLHKGLFSGYKEHATYLLFALHELMHKDDLDRFGEDYGRKLKETQNQVYETDLEKRAFELLQANYMKRGLTLPQETIAAHAEVIRVLNR